MTVHDTLMSTLPPEVRGDAERVIGARAQIDPHQVVAELHKQGLLRDDQLRDAVLALENGLKVGIRHKPPESGDPEILGPLGAGAMGEVLLAKDVGLNRVVAIKRIHAELATRSAVVDRFYREAQVTAQLDHPSIVPIHGLVQGKDGSLAYSMKLVHGRTLEAVLDEARDAWRKKGAEAVGLHLGARLEAFLQVCAAIGYAHEKGVLHRDLKPENIMVGQFGEVMVMDWGIARVLEGGGADTISGEEGNSPRKTHGTRIGAVMGTPRYMSPEQAEGRNDILDAKSDQYTLGLILFEVVTLRPAVNPELDLDGCLGWAKAAKKQTMTHLHRGGLVPRELVAIVDKATQKNPDRRYGSVADLGEDIRRYLRDEAVNAKPDTMGQRLSRWVGRHRQLMVMTVMGLMLLLVFTTSVLVVAGIGVLEWRRRAAAAREERLTELLTSVGNAARTIDSFALDIEGVATGLSFAAEASLDRPEAELVLVYDPLTESPRARKSEHYGRQISAERPSFLLAPSVGGPTVDDDIRRLAAIGYQFGRVLLDSSGKTADQRMNRKKRFDLVGKDGAPVVWAHVLTAHGVQATLPGLERPPTPGADPRKLDVYEKAREGGLVWVGPTIDPLGMGAIVTVALPLWDRKQDLLGVAAVDLGLDELALRLPKPADAQEVYLLDATGKKVVTAGMNARDLKSWSPGGVSTALLNATRKRPTGYREVDGHLEAWAAVPSLGWTYVVVGKPGVF
jgi:serine/threonine-protein kinase